MILRFFYLKIAVVTKFLLKFGRDMPHLKAYCVKCQKNSTNLPQNWPCDPTSALGCLWLLFFQNRATKPLLMAKFLFTLLANNNKLSNEPRFVSIQALFSLNSAILPIGPFQPKFDAFLFPKWIYTAVFHGKTSCCSKIEQTEPSNEPRLVHIQAVVQPQQPNLSHRPFLAQFWSFLALFSHFPSQFRELPSVLNAAWWPTALQCPSNCPQGPQPSPVSVENPEKNNKNLMLLDILRYKIYFFTKTEE